MSQIEKQILEEEQKEERARKAFIIVFWILLPFIAWIGTQIWAGILGV